jgi:hypothetical protein
MACLYWEFCTEGLGTRFDRHRKLGKRGKGRTYGDLAGELTVGERRGTVIQLHEKPRLARHPGSSRKATSSRQMTHDVLNLTQNGGGPIVLPGGG